MKVLIYNEDTNKIEIYNRKLTDPMPYTKYKYLTIKEFKSNSKSTIVWSSKKTMQAFNTTRERFGSIYVGYAFKRIIEGGHAGQSQHYAGTAFDCGQTWSVKKRKELYNLARKLGVWTYVEPIAATPRWVHFDRRNTKPACSAGYPLVKLNSINTYVMILQDGLSNLGYSISIDGVFGKKTQAAVKAFQKKYSLAADGIVGCSTWTKFVSIVKGMGTNKYTKYFQT